MDRISETPDKSVYMFMDSKTTAVKMINMGPIWLYQLYWRAIKSVIWVLKTVWVDHFLSHQREVSPFCSKLYWFCFSSGIFLIYIYIYNYIIPPFAFSSYKLSHILFFLLFLKVIASLASISCYINFCVYISTPKYNLIVYFYGSIYGIGCLEQFRNGVMSRE